MNYTTRKATLKQIAMTVGNLDTAMSHLLGVKAKYEVDHADIAFCFELAAKEILRVQGVVHELKSIL